MAAEIRGWRIIGRVQGVFFRASTRREAVRLGLGGLARNEADGSVTVVAQGAPEALDALAGWLEQGPPSARVDQVSAFSPDPDQLPAAGFETG